MVFAKRKAADLLLWFREGEKRRVSTEKPRAASHHRIRSAANTSFAAVVGMNTRVRNEMISVKQPMLFNQGSWSTGAPTIS